MVMVGRPAESNQMSLAHERQVFERRSNGEGRRVSCTLITGFLGSGKTTLVRHILRHRSDLRIAVLVNDYADLDIDSLLLDTPSVNAAFGLPSVSLVNGCACCKVSGEFKEAVDKVLRNKHNFDYLVIETSGLADPVKIAKDLRTMGVQLDMIVTVVDAEALEKVLNLPIALNQLRIADLVLVNKCDLATLGTISDVEDSIERETKGSKVVRCRFCRVPLDLVLNIANLEQKPPSSTTLVEAFDGVLSHEACSGSTFYRCSTYERNEAVNTGSSMVKTLDIDSKMELEQGKDLPISETHPSDSIFALSFTSSVPLLLNRVQSIVTDQMFHSKGLIRAKGLLWLNENRQIRLIFHWSGKKRSEATYNGQWECPPFNSIVFIGLHINELESLKHAFEDSQVGLHTIISNPSTSQGCKANSFIDTLATDSRFKVQRKDPQGVDFTHDVQTCITFGLIGSPLQGISEADLNEALMHLVNAQGILFLTAVTSSREGYLLQIALDTSKNDFENMWKELSMAAALVRAKFFKNIHRCRCDLKEHIH